MMDWNGHMTGGGWILSILGLIVVIALAVAAIAWMRREFSGRRDGGDPSSLTAREILDRRLASGEIEPAQYEQMRRTLGGTGPSKPAPPPIA